jgi:hypothetical protein
MPNFTGYPLYTALEEHVDAKGLIVSDDQRHRIKQGWIQQLAQTSEILNGTWEYRTTTITSDIANPTTQQVNVTPYAVYFYAQWDSDVSDQVLELGGAYVGCLTYGIGLSVNTIFVSKTTVTLPPILSGTELFGVLMPLK